MRALREYEELALRFIWEKKEPRPRAPFSAIQCALLIGALECFIKFSVEIKGNWMLGGSVIGGWVAFRGVRFPKGLLPAILALNLIMSVLQLFDAFGVWSFPMIHRFIVAVRFDLGFSLVPVIVPLSAVVLMSMFRGQRYVEVLLSSFFSLVISYFFGLEAAVSCFSVLLVLLSLVHLVDVGGFLFWLFVFLAGFEVASLFHWLLFLPLGLVTPFEYVANLEMNLSFIFISLVPYLVLALIFVCFLKPLIRLYEGRISVFGKLEIQKLSIFSTRTPFFLLIIFFSVLAAVYPYLPNINPIGGGVGVDIGAYLESAELIESDPTQIFEVLYGARPLIFLVIYSFQKVLSLDALTVIKYLPIILNPLMALTVYFFTKAVCDDDRTAVWASFFTVFGFPVVVGMYAYYLTNMLGLCLVYSSLGFLFRGIREGNKVSLVLAFLFGALALFTHPWAFDQYFAPLILVIFILPQMFDSDLPDHEISGKIISRMRYIIFIFLVLLFALELLKINVFQGYGGYAALKGALRRFTTVPQFWVDFIFPLKYRFGGLLSNVIVIGLALVGILAVKVRNVPGFYLWILMVATSALYLITNGVVKSRLIYNIPIGFLAALGYVSILKVTGSDEVKLSFSSFIFLSMVVYLFRSLANLI